jgi:hypothetical protein
MELKWNRLGYGSNAVHRETVHATDPRSWTNPAAAGSGPPLIKTPHRQESVRRRSQHMPGVGLEPTSRCRQRILSATKGADPGDAGA